MACVRSPYSLATLAIGSEALGCDDFILLDTFSLFVITTFLCNIWHFVEYISIYVFGIHFGQWNTLVCGFCTMLRLWCTLVCTFSVKTLLVAEYISMWILARHFMSEIHYYAKFLRTLFSGIHSCVDYINTLT